jgi:putative ABC transport system permease protein
MLKNKVFIATNVFGMGIAIACCIVTYLAYQYDATFDANHKNRDQIYRVSSLREFDNTQARYGYSPLPLGEVVDKTFSNVDRSSRYIDSWSTLKRQDDLFSAELSYVDPEFFQMFSFDFVSGSPTDLKDKSSIFINETMATKLFNSAAEAFGKTITHLVDSELRELKVAGVLRDQPPNSSFYKKSGAVYLNFDAYQESNVFINSDWKQECTVFVQINNAAQTTVARKQLQPFVENNNKVRDDFKIKEFSLDAFSTMAQTDRAEGVHARTWAAPPFAAIYGSIVMSVLILLIACFNLTNTSIALSARRLKEIGIRKVMGSRRIQLIFQFVGETTCICFVALLVGLALSDFLVVGWNILSANNVPLDPAHIATPGFMIFLFVVLLFTGVLAGSYPAFYVSKFQPVSILKGKLKFGGTSYFTRVLLGFQFVVCTITIVTAIGFFQNAGYQRSFDLGFDIRGVVVASVNSQSEFETYGNALMENPEIRSIAGAKSGIFSAREHLPVKHESRQIGVDVIEVGDQYLTAMDITLIEGRDFMKDSETDKRESIIITQKMATLFDWEKPLGKEIIFKDTVKLVVVGVVKDVYTHGLWHELEPMMIRYVGPEQYRQLVANAAPEKVSAVNTFMEEKWHSVFPNRLYSGQMLDANLQVVIDLNESITWSYAFLGIIAMLLSATGLFSLVSLNIVKRMKEIGVRKVLGASVLNIARVINFEFMVIFVIAVSLGSWCAFNWTALIMGSIWKYYQQVNIYTFMIAIGLLLVASFGTIGYKILSVATMNPVKTLQEE